MSWSSRKKKRAFLYRLFCPKKIFLIYVFYVNVQCIEYTSRTYILLHIKKTLLYTLFCLFLKSSKAFSVSLKFITQFYLLYTLNTSLSVRLLPVNKGLQLCQNKMTKICRRIFSKILKKSSLAEPIPESPCGGICF